MSDKPMSLVDEVMGMAQKYARLCVWTESQYGRNIYDSASRDNARDALRARLSALESELNDLRRIQHANEPELEMPSPERMAALRARARVERTSALPCSNVSDWDGEDGG